MIGKAISHYKILEKLGEGGMGVVYKAQDTKLDRIVALKFLSKNLLCAEEAKARFVQEAKAASALDHPNIATIYEIDEAEGECFMAMAYIEGKSIKELIKEKELSIEEILEIGIQIAEGLTKAHQKGIVHRDIKSDNVMVTDEGEVKIMDFGLAKLKGVTKLTKTGTTLGTLQYMSPEQAQGMEADHRSDIFSLGVVLYEMITGRLPFKGAHEAAVINSVVNDTPEPLTRYKSDLPGELQGIVGKAMEKDREMRCQHVDDLCADLRRLKAEQETGATNTLGTATKPTPSIAVLPFTDLSADKDQEYFCDGMAEEIINALTHVESLRVVARTSAFSFRGKEIDIRDIGKKLSVGTVLEGSVRKAGNRLRISAQLVNVTDGYHLWSEKYDRNIGDVFAIQDEISLAIVDKLKVKLLGGEKAKLVKRHTEDQEAYNLYLKGRYFWNKRTEEDLTKGIKYFEQAIEKDPHYAPAYAGIADSLSVLTAYDYLPSKEASPRAKEAALKALEIDGSHAEARTSLALIKEFYDWDWVGADREFKKIIGLNPNYATARHWYALILLDMARFDEAVKEIRKAQELDPLSLVISRTVGRVYFYARQYDQAIDALQKTLEMDPNCSWAHLHLGLVYLQKSMYEEALAEFQKEKHLSKRWDRGLECYLGISYAKMGRRVELQKVLDDLAERSKQAYVAPIPPALMYFALGENDQGFEWLEKAYEERNPSLCQLKIEPEFDRVRSDPRFIKLLKKVGLEK